MATNKISVWNGDTVARITEYIECHFEKLEDIVRSIEDRESHEQYARRKTMIPLDASGNGTYQWSPSLGTDWLLERVTVTSTGNGVCQFFVDSMALSDLVEEIGSSQVYSDAFNNNIFVPGGSTLFVVFTGAGANGQATVNLQLKMIEKLTHTHKLSHAILGES